MGQLDNWTEEFLIDEAFPIAKSDQEIVSLVNSGITLMRLASGNIHRTLGGKGNSNVALPTTGTLCHIDLGCIQLANERFYFASHCSLRRNYFSTKGVLVMNAEFYKNRRVSVRGHPGDGKFEVLTSELKLIQYLLASKRSESGNHLPHPDLKVRSTAQYEVSFPHQMRVYADGRLIGRSDEVEISVVSRAVKVVIA